MTEYRIDIPNAARPGSPTRGELICETIRRLGGDVATFADHAAGRRMVEQYALGIWDADMFEVAARNLILAVPTLRKS